jgi:hypothetical protein
MNKTDSNTLIKNKAVLMGGIIKHNRDYGFKITFSDIEDARKYKDMIYWIIKNDNIRCIMNFGYYDDKEKYSYEGNEK